MIDEVFLKWNENQLFYRSDGARIAQTERKKSYRNQCQCEIKNNDSNFDDIRKGCNSQYCIIPHCLIYTSRGYYSAPTVSNTSSSKYVSSSSKARNLDMNHYSNDNHGLGDITIDVLSSLDKEWDND